MRVTRNADGNTERHMGAPDQRDAGYEGFRRGTAEIPAKRGIRDGSTRGYSILLLYYTTTKPAPSLYVG